MRDENVARNLEKARRPRVFSVITFLRWSKRAPPAKMLMPGFRAARWRASRGKDEFIDLLLQHEQIREYLSPAKIRELGSMKFQLRHVREILCVCTREKDLREPRRKK